MADAYYQVPNMYIPLNDRKPGEIADVAQQQLAHWQAVARDWGVYTDGRENRCAECHQNIWFSMDAARHPYTYTDDEILALKVAHVRQCHSEAGNRDYLHNVGSADNNGQENGSS
jgi:hypothetical protein